jgi:hypothetical protein
MPRDDDAAAAAAVHDMAATTQPERMPVGFGALSIGGTVVAGPPDDAFEMASMEIFAALCDAPVPGAL